MRLKVIAALRAPTIASVIQISFEAQKPAVLRGHLPRGQRHPQKGERQREERVLDLYHLERNAQTRFQALGFWTQVMSCRFHYFASSSLIL
jgi:hypothetical protein